LREQARRVRLHSSSAVFLFEVCNEFCVVLCFRNTLLIFRSRRRRTALHLAVSYGHVNTVKVCQLLIAAKADVNAADGCAFMSSKIVADRVLYCVFGNLLLIFCSSFQYTALHCAAQDEVCQLLITAKAAVNATDGCALIFSKIVADFVLCCISFVLGFRRSVAVFKPPLCISLHVMAALKRASGLLQEKLT